MTKPFAAIAALLLFAATPAAAQLQYMDYSGGSKSPPNVREAAPAPAPAPSRRTTRARSAACAPPATRRSAWN